MEEMKAQKEKRIEEARRQRKQAQKIVEQMAEYEPVTLMVHTPAGVVYHKFNYDVQYIDEDGKLVTIKRKKREKEGE